MSDRTQDEVIKEIPPDQPVYRSPLLDLADHYYAVSSDLMRQADELRRMAEMIGMFADRMCEQNMRETK